MALTQVDQGLLGQYAQYTGFKNRIINGAMMIDQRNAGASGTGNNNYTVDRWQYFGTQASKGTWQQNAGSVTPPAGFTNYLGFTSSSAYSLGAGDVFQILQQIEGLNVADLGWGAVGAQPVTLSFWVRSSLTGTHGGALQNSTAARSYPFTFTVNSANTWEYKTVTVQGDTTGTWRTDNQRGVCVTFNLGAGSTYSGTANTWGGSPYYAPTGAVSVVGTNGATFYITGVQLEKGSTATSFDYRPYGTELALCERYYWKLNKESSSGMRYGPGYAFSTTDSRIMFQFPVDMRAAPTLVTTGNSADYRVLTAGAAYGCTAAPSANLTTTQNSEVSFTTGASLTAGYGVMALSFTTSSYIAWNAEL